MVDLMEAGAPATVEQPRDGDPVHLVRDAPRRVTMTEEARKNLGQQLYAIGWLVLMAFGVCTMLYWVGAMSPEMTDNLKVILGGPAMILLITGRLMSTPRKKTGHAEQSKKTSAAS
jgi:hypothetical protein